MLAGGTRLLAWPLARANTCHGPYAAARYESRASRRVLFRIKVARWVLLVQPLAWVRVHSSCVSHASRLPVGPHAMRAMRAERGVPIATALVKHRALVAW